LRDREIAGLGGLISREGREITGVRDGVALRCGIQPRLGGDVSPSRGSLTHFAGQRVRVSLDAGSLIAVARGLIAVCGELVTIGARLIAVRARLIAVCERLVARGCGVISVAEALIAVVGRVRIGGRT
jgi:hypothetical protein